jgi:hypothetical protein
MKQKKKQANQSQNFGSTKKNCKIIRMGENLNL